MLASTVRRWIPVRNVTITTPNAHPQVASVASVSARRTGASQCSRYRIDTRDVAMRGMKPMDAILTATRNAADVLGWSDRVGAIVPGHFADIIAVEGDPLRNITELERVRFVMKGGVTFKE